MRLLDARALINDGRAKLVEYVDERALPPYAILSHTWGQAGEEVLFEDIRSGWTPWATSRLGADNCSRCYCKHQSATPTSEVKVGWTKVYKAAERACLDGYKFLWIDTCCIDKSSSAELSEAINSMFRWYQKAAVCYVYLNDFKLNLGDDVEIDEGAHADRRRSLGSWNASDDDINAMVKPGYILSDRDITQLHQCRWFTRGWTLQELIAPQNVLFYDMSWTYISQKRDMFNALEDITGIDQAALRGWSINTFSVAQRMSWASNRATTRIEDEAYSLLGLFDINMPLLYGEGHRAFRRLQEAILSKTTDTSIFAWELLPGDNNSDISHALFAPSAAYFWWHAREIEYDEPFLNGHRFADHRMTSQGMHLSLGVHHWRRNGDFDVVFACLSCTVTLKTLSGNVNRYKLGLRIRNRPLPQDSSMLVTYVDPEQASTLEEAWTSVRRLVLLEDEQYDTKIDPSIRSLLISDGLIPFLPRRVAASQPGYVKIQLQLPSVSNRRTWRVLSAHPKFQWHASDCAFIFSIATGTVFGALLIEIEHGQLCRVVVGFSIARQLEKSIRSFEKGYLQYWLFPYSGFGKSSDDALSSTIDQVTSFASKDMFEGKTVRQSGNKVLLLPDLDLLRISPVDQVLHQTVAVMALSHLELCLRLTVDTELGAELAELPEFENLKTYHGTQLSRDSKWQLARNLIVNLFTGKSVTTHAWCVQRGSRSLLMLRCVDFEKAVFDRTLWGPENPNLVEPITGPDLGELGEGTIPLLWIAGTGNTTLARHLLETAQVDVNTKDNFGRTALTMAAANGHAGLVGLLLGISGIDIDIADQYSRTPLIYAAKNGHEAVAKLLLDTDKVNVNFKDDYLCTPLGHALNNNHTAVARLFLDSHTIEAGSANRLGATPLHLAATAGQQDLVKRLLDMVEINVNITDGVGRTPISWAAENGHAGVVQVLLNKSGVEVDIRDKLARTPLSYALGGGHELVVKLLLETNKADPEAMDTFGRTPLMWSGKCESPAPSERLIDAITSRKQGFRHNTIRTALQSHDLLGCSFVHFAAMGNSLSGLKLSFEHGIDVDSVDDQGWTPLHWCAYFGSTVAARFLLQHHASLTIENRQHQTPYDIALFSGNITLASELRPEGVSLERRNVSRAGKIKYLPAWCDSCNHVSSPHTYLTWYEPEAAE